MGPIAQKWPIPKVFCLACHRDCTDAHVEFALILDTIVAHACLKHGSIVLGWMEDRYPKVEWAVDSDSRAWRWARTGTA